MQHVRLVTFDVFGTLLDWQSYVDQAFPGRFPAFLQASAPKQEPGSAIFPYRDLLYDVGMDLSPRASREVLTFFSEGLGFTRPFADARAIQHLSTMAMVGCVSNCDFRHLVDVQKTLGCLFDVAVTAEELRAYKPHAEAWDLIVETVTRKLGFDKGSWLHVSSSHEFDLVPARERGVTVCYLPRPGSNDAAAAALLAPDYSVSDLWELARLVEQLNGTPVRYAVRATTKTPEIAQEFVRWMRYEHGPELLGVRACQRFQVLRLSATEVLCEYVFTNRTALEEYYAGPAQRLRQKGRDRFPEGDVAFERSEAELDAGFGQRNRYDFRP